MYSPLAITGMGLTTALGIGVEKNWRRLLSGESAIRPVRSLDVGDYPVKDGCEVPDPPELEPFADGRPAPPELRHLVTVCREAFMSAGGSEDWLPAEPQRVGLAIGSSLAASTISEAFFRSRRERGRKDAEYGILRGYHVDRQFEYVLSGIGVEGPCLLVSNACAAGAGAVSRAADWIRSGRCDAAVAAGADAFSIFTFAGFGSLMALSRSLPRPFSADRDGMKMAGGYAALVLEPLERALARGRRPLALLSGYGESSDAHHLTHPHPEGHGAALAMRRALDMAGLEPEAIDAVNCHATSTRSNDASEARALATVFGDRLVSLPLYAPKPAVGHTLGGAGTVEAVISICFLQHQALAPTLNTTEIDPEIGLELDLIAESRSETLRHVMSNSFGFGGSNGSLILSAWEGETAGGGDGGGDP